jgi:GNAT superfamily N-acetyltransferase
MNNIIDKLGFLAGGSRFRRIYEKLQIGGDKVYKESGLNFKSSWFPVYYVLSVSDRPQTIMEITSQIAFTHITVKNIVNELNNENLLIISSNPNDKRSKLISLSEKGISLLNQLEPIWMRFFNTLKKILTAGHPDIINILGRIDSELTKKPLNEQVRSSDKSEILILDYKPDLKKYFYELAGHWLYSILKGELEDEDIFTLRNPDKAYLEKGGFLFFAQYDDKTVGCVALKRLDDGSFEFAKLFVDPRYRSYGIATKLIERCICRCKENASKQLWLQTDMSMKEAHRIYNRMGFIEKSSPSAMHVLKRTELIMSIDL